jgi:hypothetical protein
MRRILTALVLWGAFALGVSAEEYTIKRGDTLRKIVQQQNVGREHPFTVDELLIANPELLQRSLENCASKSDAYRTSATRTGYFCNEVRPGKYEVGANSIVAGWKVRIPSASAPVEVAATIASVPGRRIALVVDATGSMSGNIGLLADQYRSAIRQHGKEVVGVWLFADGKVWTVRAENFLSEYKTGGGIENTYAALVEANRLRPDAIMLFTDEPGDDWPMDGRFAIAAPVFAHCLPQHGGAVHTCGPTLQKLVRAVPGSRYIAVAHEPLIANRQQANVPPVSQPPSGHVPPIRRQRPQESPMDHIFKR